jgi:hypothetical protein
VKRREFFTALGGAVVAWPLVARAQQPDRIRRIGVLMNLSVDDPEAPSRVAAFAQGLGELGWNIGRNVWIDPRWGGGGSGAADSVVRPISIATPVRSLFPRLRVRALAAVGRVSAAHRRPVARADQASVPAWPGF